MEGLNSLTALLGAGIAIGSAAFFVAAFKAWRSVEAKAAGASRTGRRDLRGAAWVALAACGALYAYTCVEFLARLNEEQAELTRRKTIVTSLDKKMSVYRSGLMKLNDVVSQAKGQQAGVPPERLADHIETILAEIRKRERLF